VGRIMTIYSLLIILLLFYLVVKLVKEFSNQPRRQSEIRGQPHKKSELDLSNADVEDADFEEVDENN